MSSFTHSIHVFLGLPFLTPPTTSKFLHLETQSSASLRSTCPNHLSLPRLTTSSTPSIPSPRLSYYYSTFIYPLHQTTLLVPLLLYFYLTICPLSLLIETANHWN